MADLTVAVCTYNRAERLAGLIAALRSQDFGVAFEILVVDNNSTDDTLTVLNRLRSDIGAPLRYVLEQRQGIVFARNRAIDECRDRRFLVFVDDDELPKPGWLEAAHHALAIEGADCVGGRIEVECPERPRWLTDELSGFLGKLDYGDTPFWVKEHVTPLWSGNIGYRMAVFATAGLRFDGRYNRAGCGTGGGEDAVMFRLLLARKARIRYRPDMVVAHYVERWKLRRRYFLKLHYIAGRKAGQYDLNGKGRELFGVPLYLFQQAIRQWVRAVRMYTKGDRNALRQAMNGAYAMGLIRGSRLRSRAQGAAGSI